MGLGFFWEGWFQRLSSPAINDEELSMLETTNMRFHFLQGPRKAVVETPGLGKFWVAASSPSIGPPLRPPHGGCLRRSTLWSQAILICRLSRLLAQSDSRALVGYEGYRESRFTVQH
jgi:hypothetical protein